MKLNRRVSVGLAFGILSLIVFVVAHAAPTADEKKPEPPGKGDVTFAGKILAVYEKAAAREDSGFIIEDASVADLRGTRVLVGKIANRDDWMTGLKVYVPMDNISSIVECDNMAEFNKRVPAQTDNRRSNPRPDAVMQGSGTLRVDEAPETACGPDSIGFRRCVTGGTAWPRNHDSSSSRRGARLSLAASQKRFDFQLASRSGVTASVQNWNVSVVIGNRLLLSVASSHR